jgi:hypothetical protein
MLFALALVPILLVRWWFIPTRGGHYQNLQFLEPIVVVCGISTVVFAILARRTSNRFSTFDLITFFAIGSIEIIAGLWFLPRYREYGYSWSANRGTDHAWTECASRLRNLGLSMIMYANDHDGHFPERIEVLAAPDGTTVPLEPRDFVCPLSGHSPATGTTTQEVTANIVVGNHLSYEYVGKGLTLKTTGAKTVLAYDLPTNHAQTKLRLHVLYGDCHIESVSESRLRQIIEEIADGHNPPP